MKTLLTLFLLSAFCSQLFGQSYTIKTLTLNTNMIQTNATQTMNAPMDCRLQKDVAVSIAFNLNIAGTANQTLTFARAIDTNSTALTLETLTAKKTVVVIAATGTTTNVTVTNIPTYGAGWVYLESWNNAAADASATNIAVRWAKKTSVP